MLLPTVSNADTIVSIPQIFFQHQDWLILYKPEGFSVQNLAEFYRPHFPDFHPVHRLDKDTSGLWLIALNSESNQILSQLFQKKQVKKTYLAVLESKGMKKKQGLIVGDMEKSRRKSWRLMTTKKNPARTRFYSVSLGQGQRLAWLEPTTGKTHQLRVAMKSNTSAIAGDEIYNAQTLENFDRLYLHAFALSFVYKGKPFEFSCLPNSGVHFLSDDFKRALTEVSLKSQR